MTYDKSTDLCLSRVLVEIKYRNTRDIRRFGKYIANITSKFIKP